MTFSPSNQRWRWSVEPRFLPAKLIKLQTSDGLVEFDPLQTRIGAIYIVDVHSVRRSASLYNENKNQHHQKDIIFANSGTWIPLECLLLLP